MAANVVVTHGQKEGEAEDNYDDEDDVEHVDDNFVLVLTRLLLYK